MKQSILQIYSEGSVEQISKSTLSALQRRDIVNVSNKLTNFGVRCAILQMPLIKQCSELSIDYKEVSLQYSGKPEIALLSYYQSLGFIGISTEGAGILTILKALMLDELTKHNFLNSRTDACSRYLSAQFVINSDVIENIISSIPLTSRERFISNFDEIISESYIAYRNPELSLEFAIAIYDSLDINTFVSIARKLSEDPYNYSNGWPDLTLIKGTDILFIEVKVRDKLHESQIITIPEIQKIIPASFCICKLLRVN
jgi:hypothetical protein